MPVDRHRFTRLAFEPPPGLLAQHPILPCFYYALDFDWMLINRLIFVTEKKIENPESFKRNQNL